MSELTESFYLVWNEHRGLPKMKHDTYGSACEEAARLAQQQPGEKFHVLRSICEAQMETPVTFKPHKETY